MTAIAEQVTFRVSVQQVVRRTVEFEIVAESVRRAESAGAEQDGGAVVCPECRA